MKQGNWNERPGIRYGWAVMTNGGYLYGEVRSTKREVIDIALQGWGPEWTWRKAKKKYGLRVVWVKVEICP